MSKQKRSAKTLYKQLKGSMKNQRTGCLVITALNASKEGHYTCDIYDIAIAVDKALEIPKATSSLECRLIAYKIRKRGNYFYDSDIPF